MEKGLFDKVDAKYLSISSFIKDLAERNDLDVAGYKAELAKLLKDFDSFGDVFTEFMLGYLQEIEQFERDREKWNAEKLETDEIIKRLEERLKELEKQVPKADYNYWVIYCEKKFKGYWNLLDESTQSILVTACYLMKIVQSKQIDYSIIIIELSKSLETEIKIKMYYPFVQNLPHIYENDNSVFAGFIKHYLSDHNSHISLGTLLGTLKKPKYMINTYMTDFHAFLFKNGWQMEVLYKENFGDIGFQYSKKYRNNAAHEVIKDKSLTSTCMIETKDLFDIMFSSYTPK